jgi:hypothetical protein
MLPGAHLIKTKAHRPQSIMLALYRIPHHRKGAIVAETTKQPAFRSMTILFSIALYMRMSTQDEDLHCYGPLPWRRPLSVTSLNLLQT